MAAGSTFAVTTSLKLSNPKSFLASTKSQQVKFSTPFLSRNFSLIKTSNLSKMSFICKNQTDPNSVPPGPAAGEIQELNVYELNERDRGSPVYLPLSGKKPVKSLGDLVPFTNKLYTADLQKRVGITAGITILIKNVPEKNGDRYEAIMSFYFGDYGHIAVQGPYITYEDTYLAVLGGSGAFEGVSGKVKLHNIVYPVKQLYTFYLKGIPALPAELIVETVEPSPSIEAAEAAKKTQPQATIPNYTD